MTVRDLKCEQYFTSVKTQFFFKQTANNTEVMLI